MQRTTNLPSLGRLFATNFQDVLGVARGDFRRSDFVIRTFSRGPLLLLTNNLKFGTLYHIKAQWACLPVPDCRILLGDSE
jgi:hypothetical protein